MARAETTDFLHSFRFHVTADDGAPAGAVFDTQAGFNTVTTPEMSVEVAEYKEGIYTFTRKYPGNPSMNDLTLTRGVVKSDSKFMEWVQAAISGAEYRTDLDIRHYHREDFGSFAEVETSARGTAARIYQVSNAMPLRVKVAGDLDAATSDVSIQEIDVAFESFTVTEQ
jgi:phage tail-like protein